jgi:uncharacterized protein YwlG (UPF0340 family)
MKTPQEWAAQWEKECLAFASLEKDPKDPTCEGKLAFSQMRDCVASIVERAMAREKDEGFDIGADTVFGISIKHLETLIESMKKAKKDAPWKNPE